MRIFHTFLRWGMLYLLVIATAAACIWENTLAVPSIDHTLLLAGILILAWILINSWISHHEANLLVPHDELKLFSEHTLEEGPHSQRETDLEKTK